MTDTMPPSAESDSDELLPITIRTPEMEMAELGEDVGAAAELKISEIYVNEGLTMKRIKPRAKGRADRIFKRTSHITVTVTDE